MRFFQMVASSAAFLAAALALEINQYPTGGVQVGQTYTITYSPADNTPTTFLLRKGVSTDLNTVGTLTTTATGGTFSWTVDSSLANGADYALEIRREGQSPNYSSQFALTGSSASAGPLVAASSSVSSASLYSLISSAQASGTGAVASIRNGAVSSATVSATASRATGSVTGSASIPESTGAGSSLPSAPLALLFGAAGAFSFLN